MLGSTNFLTDDAQELVAHEEYFPTGELWVDESDRRFLDRQSYLFAGKELDSGTGLYYFGARYYDPRLSIWSGTDPSLRQYVSGGGHTNGVYSPANLSLYSYGWNNPLTFTDPDGRDVIIVLGPQKGSGLPISQTGKVLGGQLKLAGIPYRTVDLGRKGATIQSAAAAIEASGRKVSGVVFIGHGNDAGQVATNRLDPTGGRTPLSAIAEQAHVQKGGVAMALACNVCSNHGPVDDQVQLEKSGVSVAGFEEYFEFDHRGTGKVTMVQNNRLVARNKNELLMPGDIKTARCLGRR